MFEREISKLEARIERRNLMLPKWLGKSFGRILVLENQSDRKEIQSLRDREKDIKENPDLWGG